MMYKSFLIASTLLLSQSKRNPSNHNRIARTALSKSKIYQSSTANSEDKSYGGVTYRTSSYSVQGRRPYMEDEYIVEFSGRLAGVFDGHGGKRVSQYVAANIVNNYFGLLVDPASNYSKDYIVNALRKSVEGVDRDVLKQSPKWIHEGCTLTMAYIHEEKKTLPSCEEGEDTSYITINVGDSRIVLSRGGKAIDLTVDHSPEDPNERNRIEALGGKVRWFGQVDKSGQPVLESGCFRINGNLNLSRAIGDLAERPFITSVPDINITPADVEVDDFILIATDGLYEVFTSARAVQIVNQALDRIPSLVENTVKSAAEVTAYVKDNMARFLVDRALAEGSNDNISVIIQWLK